MSREIRGISNFYRHLSKKKMADLLSLGLPGEELAKEVLISLRQLRADKITLIQLGTPEAKEELARIADLEFFPLWLIRRWNGLLKKIDPAPPQ